MLLLTILLPTAGGILISVLPAERHTRHIAYGTMLLVTDLFGILSMIEGKSLRLFTLAENYDIVFIPDALGVLFLSAALLLYTAVCFYAFEYMRMEEREEQFFAFYFVSLSAVVSACMAGNPVTLYLCFELATLSSMPMVLHERTKESIAAALKYLFYSIGGAFLGLFAIVTLCAFSKSANAFVPGGFPDLPMTAPYADFIRAAVFCGIVGFGAKAGMYPLHGWLPAAHPIAPAPASALLSGMIAKMGILAVIRLVYFCSGTALLRGTWVQTAWICLAMLTVFMGSMTAFLEKNLKRRLAYSSISQISYIMLGLAMMNETGLTGGLIHFTAHAVSKGTLFLCAGVFIYRLGRRAVYELRGLGAQMPVTMWCFLIASLSLIGIPPMGGFVSKWYLSLGSLGNGAGMLSVLPVVMLLVSALLTAGYLLPVAVDAFFPGRGAATPERRVNPDRRKTPNGQRTAPDGKPLPDPRVNPDRRISREEPSVNAPDTPENSSGKQNPDTVPECAEPSLLMTVPMIILCIVALCVGMFGSSFAQWLSSAVMRGLF